MYGGDCDAAIAEAAAAVTHVQSQSQEVGSGDEGLGLLCFDLSSAGTDFWWLEDEQVETSPLLSSEIVKHSKTKTHTACVAVTATQLWPKLPPL